MGVQGKNIKRFSLAQMTWEDLSGEQGLRQEMESARQAHRDHFRWKGTMRHGSEMRKSLVCSRIKKRQGLLRLGHRSKRGGHHCDVFSSWFYRESRSSEGKAFHNARGRGTNRLIYLSHLTKTWKMNLKGAGIKSRVKGQSGGLTERCWLLGGWWRQWSYKEADGK